MQWSYIIKTLLFHVSTQPRFHSSCHGKRPLTCSTCGRIYQQEFTNNNNLSYHVSLMISKTLNRFQNIGKAINLRILDQHFQNFELGKKDIQLSSIAVDHMSLLIADSSWIVRPRVTAAMHQSSFRYFSRYFTETAETCHCSDIKCAVLITIPSPS